MFPTEREPVLILGDGGWGTALALVLHGSGRTVRLWSHDPDYAALLGSTRRNPKFLPGVVLPEGLEITSDVAAAARGARTVFSVIPTQFLRRVLERIALHLSGEGTIGERTIVSCSKGIERGTLALPSSILSEVLPGSRRVILSGPSHAEEVSLGLPTAIVAASKDGESALGVQSLLVSARLRVYTSSDPVGVEVGGATKNVIALAAGISDGLGFGDNARSGLITRGLREITRLGVAMGAAEITFSGLSGMGDLIATCTSAHSRNRTVGLRIGQGEKLEQILRSTEKVAEGVETTRSVHDLAEKLGVEVPITREVHAVLFRGKAPRDAVEALMSREIKGERR